MLPKKPIQNFGYENNQDPIFGNNPPVFKPEEHKVPPVQAKRHAPVHNVFDPNMVKAAPIPPVQTPPKYEPI